MNAQKQKHINCITINTDASFSNEYKIGSYAFYIVCDLFKIQKSGLFKKSPKNSLEAEMMCIANAMYTLLTQKELPSTNWIVINSDALYAFVKIKRKSDDQIGKKIAELLRLVRTKTAFRGLDLPKFEFRHVKAHTNNTDSRSKANEWCDNEAKKWLRKEVEKLKTITK